MKNMVLDLTCGYIIQLPYDEAVDTLVIVSVIPQSDFACEFIEKNKDNIIHTEPREDGEDIVSFCGRLEKIVQKKRNEKLSPEKFN